LGDRDVVVKSPQERPKYDMLTRMESTIAEIMRINYPFSVSNEAGNMWLDIVEALDKVFKTGKPRFNSDLFFEHCFGEEWAGTDGMTGEEVKAATVHQRFPDTLSLD
jgi:hypothetical protein